MEIFTEFPAKGQDPPSKPLKSVAERDRHATGLYGNNLPDG